MSKYGGLRANEGHSKYFLQSTLVEHDATMDHPAMEAIYRQKITDEQYLTWLSSQYHVFSAMEQTASTVEASNDSLTRFRDCRLHRAQAAELDLVESYGPDWRDRDNAAVSPKTAEYLEMLSQDAASPLLWLCHHFLQYNAVLSGGQYLKAMMNKKRGLKGSNTTGVQFFCFESLSAKEHPKYVQEYCGKMDALTLTEAEREAMLACMLRVYRLILEQFDEVIPRGLEQSAAKPLKETNIEPALSALSLDALHSYDGSSEEGPEARRILMSIRGRLMDVSSSWDSYGPGGSYRLFAGRDVTRCLATMSLEVGDLDDLDYMPESPEQEAALARWEARLGAMYVVVGGLEGDERGQVELEGDESLLPPATETDTQGAAAASCPFTGQATGSCPFGFQGTESTASSAPPKQGVDGECPWPFIMLHDAKVGWEKHREKNLLAGAAAAVAAAAVAARWAQHAH